MKKIDLQVSAGARKDRGGERKNKGNVYGTVCVVKVMRYWNREEQEGT